jgi:hypothetical protein
MAMVNRDRIEGATSANLNPPQQHAGAVIDYQEAANSPLPYLLSLLNRNSYQIFPRINMLRSTMFMRYKISV